MDDRREFRVQFTLRALLVTIVAIACSLGAGVWFGVQAALAVIALALTSYAVIRGGPRAIASPNGLIWLSALLMFFSGFYVSTYGPMGGEFRLFASLQYSVVWDPLILAATWLTFSLIAFAMLVGTMAYAQIVFCAPWRCRHLGTLAFLFLNAVGSGFVSVEFLVARETSPVMFFMFGVSVATLVLYFLLRESGLAESHLGALVDTLAVMSMLPVYVPFDIGLEKAGTTPATYGAGAGMLLVGSSGLIAANVWLWCRADAIMIETPPEVSAE